MICDLIRQVGTAEVELAAARSEQINLWKLVSQYQCNPTGKLTLFEALRNHLEMSHRTCNENYAWAKRTETELSAARSESTQLREALQSIEEWRLPETGETWPSGGKVSYEANYGSRGVQQYIRGVARAALVPVPGSSAKEKP